MTILYKPVLIESAAQAEALPEGTVLVQGIYSLVVGNDWHTARHESTIGWTALVPIEAEEEHAEKAVAEGEFTGIVRLVTEWEDAS